MAAMCQPDSVYWCDGSDEEKRRLTAEALKSGEILELIKPCCRCYCTEPRPTIARTEHLTICTSFQGDAGHQQLDEPREGYASAEYFSGP